ncbi:hypothetical protein C8F01DRAFT_1092479 [Mycena amicta]|nr:hypothetical protein C8F01DRAFT_1092479 [Mycena amicta]
MPVHHNHRPNTCPSGVPSVNARRAVPVQTERVERQPGSRTRYRKRGRACGQRRGAESEGSGNLPMGILFDDDEESTTTEKDGQRCQLVFLRNPQEPLQAAFEDGATVEDKSQNTVPMRDVRQTETLLQSESVERDLWPLNEASGNLRDWWWCIKQFGPKPGSLAVDDDDDCRRVADWLRSSSEAVVVVDFQQSAVCFDHLAS